MRSLRSAAWSVLILAGLLACNTILGNESATYGDAGGVTDAGSDTDGGDGLGSRGRGPTD
jgi:hypothetical protein